MPYQFSPNQRDVTPKQKSNKSSKKFVKIPSLVTLFVMCELMTYIR